MEKETVLEVAQELDNLVRARYTFIAVQTYEEGRVENIMKGIAVSRSKDFLVWNCNRGLLKQNADGTENNVGDSKQMSQPGAVLTYIQEYSNDAIFLLQDFQMFLDKSPKIDRQVKDLVQSLQITKKTVVVTGVNINIPHNLDKHIALIDFPMPDRATMLENLEQMIEEMSRVPKITINIDDQGKERLVEAAMGLTINEAKNVFAKAVVSKGRLDIDAVSLITKEKQQIVRKSGILEFYPISSGMDDIGGLDLLKKYIEDRSGWWGSDVKEFGLSYLKGAVLIGIPGCLSGDSKLRVLRGKRVGGREYTAKELYYKFNGIKTSTKGWDMDIRSYTHSVNNDGSIFYNEIKAVVYKGYQEVFKVKTAKGYSGKYTKDHPFKVLTGGDAEGYKELSVLKVGDSIYTRENILPKGKIFKARYECRKEISGLKYYSKGNKHNVNGYEYRRQRVSILTVEADMNGMFLHTFLKYLKTDELGSGDLIVLDDGLVVHHKNGIVSDDTLDNLEVMTLHDHELLHKRERNFNNTKVVLDEIVQIESKGFEDVYDIVMADPQRNYLVNNMWVHNCGKSLTAKTIANYWGLPLLRLDMGKIFDKFVGGSEENIRKALNTAEAVAPCVLWLDEVEKAMASGSGDNGTSRRVLGNFLTWMQEKESPVFVVCTANKVTGDGALPPEFLRKGRFDELFFIDLPTQGELIDILAIHLHKKGRELSVSALTEVAKECKGYSGAEIEAAVDNALWKVFKKKGKITKKVLIESVKESKPLSETMKQELDATKEWAKGRVRYASSAIEAVVRKEMVQNVQIEVD